MKKHEVDSVVNKLLEAINWVQISP
jgi:hypothetical protein